MTWEWNRDSRNTERVKEKQLRPIFNADLDMILYSLKILGKEFVKN